MPQTTKRRIWILASFLITAPLVVMATCQLTLDEPFDFDRIPIDISIPTSN